MTRSVVIIGASRGIGLGFAQSYAEDGWQVHATTRTPGASGKINQIKGDVSIYELEIRDSEQISALEENFIDRGIDVLIHNAGVYGKDMSYEEVMAINAKAPFNVVNALLPAVHRSKIGKIVILTSQMGARHGGGIPSSLYGQSKCALNDTFRDTESGWRKSGIIAIVIHPGWVRTDMGGLLAPVSVKKSVTGMREVIDKLTPTDSGSFYTWKGEKHPW